MSATIWALQKLQQAGWEIELAEAPLPIPAIIRERYPDLPETMVEFLLLQRQCHNVDETAWFLSWADYEGTSDSGFRWNEFEIMESEWAFQDNDLAWHNQVKEFWDNHFPFLLSFKTGYSYFAVRLCESNFEKVVHGYEPMFTETSEIATTFEEFLQLLAKTVSQPNGEGLLQAAV
ncbi:MAG TPA: hypothetical protein VGB77_16920 [Abditibacteriaceae bacterium]|jgi:hypothetical protein